MAFFDKDSIDPKKLIPKFLKFYTIDINNPFTFLVSNVYLETGLDKLSKLIAELGNKAGVFVDNLTGFELSSRLLIQPLTEQLNFGESLLGNFDSATNFNEVIAERELTTLLETVLEIPPIDNFDIIALIDNLPAQQSSDISENITIDDTTPQQEYSERLETLNTNDDLPQQPTYVSQENATIESALYPIRLEINHYVDHIPDTITNYEDYNEDFEAGYMTWWTDPEHSALYESTVNYMVWWIEDNTYTQAFPTLQMQNHYLDYIPYPNDYPDEYEQVVNYLVWWE